MSLRSCACWRATGTTCGWRPPRSRSLLDSRNELGIADEERRPGCQVIVQLEHSETGGGQLIGFRWRQAHHRRADRSAPLTPPAQTFKGEQWPSTIFAIPPCAERSSGQLPPGALAEGIPAAPQS